MKAIITGGGTGGHIYPALAIASELKNKGWEILYIGSKARMEADIVPEAGFDFKGLPLMSLPRSLSWKILSSPYYNIISFFKTLKIIKNYQADLIIGTGGFVAGPVVLAGAILRKKTIIHEQNAYPGLTNKLLAKFVDKICLNFADSKKHLNVDSAKIKITGNPVRKEIINAKPEKAYKKLNLDRDLKTILITGGSLGSEIINKNIIPVYNYALKNKIQIIHLTGKNNYKLLIKRLKRNNIDSNNYLINIFSYLNEMEYALAAADLIISRAGATALAEITSCGIPSILIPFSAAAANHQLFNAQALAAKNAAVIIEESNLTKELLLMKVQNIISSEKKLQRMSKGAQKLSQKNSLKNIIKEIEEISFN